MDYIKPEIINLKGHSEFNETWVQKIIAEDPSILNLGNLILKDKERNQPSSGRLDLLLQDEESTKRYEVEIQLGRVDESHIIRTIEYWDIERKRYPQYEHSAVIIAEDITSRFLNVISLFNGVIPLIAIQMSAVKIGNTISLLFTKVLDQTNLGLVDEDEEVYEATDRNYWEVKSNKQTVALADELLKIILTFVPGLELKYNKFYIGLAKNNQTNNFAIFRPQKNVIRIEVRIPKSDEMDQKIESNELDILDYDAKWGRYRIKLSKDQIQRKKDFLGEIMKLAFER